VNGCAGAHTKCNSDAAGDPAKTCACFRALVGCVKRLTPCTTAPITVTDKEIEVAIDTCVKVSRCTEAQCKALVTDTDNDTNTSKDLVFVAPIVVVGVLLCALGGIGVAVVLCQRQRVVQAHAAANQEAVIAGLGVGNGKPSAPPPEPEFLQELEMLNNR